MTHQTNSSVEDIIIHKRLSVQLSLSGLSFLVTAIETQKTVFFSEKKYAQKQSPEELLLHLQSEFNSNTELQEIFKEVKIIYATSLYSVIPSSLFDETKVSDYLKFNSKILVNDFVAFDTLENNDITVVYIPFININNYIFEKFGDFNYFHSTTLLLEYTLNKEKQYSLPRVYIDVLPSSFNIIVIKNGGLLLCNSFDFRTVEDFIYYVLFCLEQLKLNPDTIDIVLSGDIEESNDLYQMLYKYVRNITFSNYKDELNIENRSSKDTYQHLLLKLAN